MIDLGAWWDRLATAFNHPAFHGAVLALLIGVALAEFLIQVAPQAWPGRWTERAVRGLVLGVVALVGYWFHPTTIGAGWSLFAGLMAPSLHHHLQAWLYARYPALVPKVLRS